MFINLSFTLNGAKQTGTTKTELLTVGKAKDISFFIAKKGDEYDDVNSLAESIRQKLFIDYSLVKEYVIQMMELRFVALCWMNKKAVIDYDQNNNPIYNTIIPTGQTELNDSVFFTCNRDFDKYKSIYKFSTLGEVRSDFDYVVGLLVSYSKKNGSGDWAYYEKKALKNFDYDELKNEIRLARML